MKTALGVCPDWKNLRLCRRKSGSLPLSVPQSAQRLLYGKADGDYEAEGAGNPKGARLGKGLQTDGLYPPFYFLWCHGDGKAVACGGNAALQGRNDGFNGKNHAPHFSIIVCGLNLRLQKEGSVIIKNYLKRKGSKKMQNGKKKVLALLLAGCCVLSACGTKTDDTKQRRREILSPAQWNVRRFMSVPKSPGYSDRYSRRGRAGG